MKSSISQLIQESERRGRLRPGQLKLHAKQRQFLALEALEVLYGGAAGGGKTEALLAEMLQWVKHPHYKALILRRSYPELAKPGAIMHRALSWLGHDFWSEQQKRFTFPTGAIIQFGYVSGPADLAQFKSTEFHHIGIDELTEWAESDYLFLFSRIRKNVGDPIPLKMRAGTNPDGIGAPWVAERFGISESRLPSTVDEEESVKSAKPEPIYTFDAATGDTRVFLPARAEDNPTLDLEAYDKNLKRLGVAKYWQLRWGLWVRDGEGLVYGGFDEAINLIESAPECSHTILAQDYGTTNATSWNILGWRENDPTVYVLRSFKLSGVIPSRNAEMVGELEKKWKFASIVGDVGGLGKAYAEEARRRFMIPIEPADKNNKRGYIEIFNGEMSLGRIKVVKPACEDLVKEYKTLPWATNSNRTVEAPSFPNHCTDGVLYGWRKASAFAEQLPPPTPKDASEQTRRELDDYWEREEASEKAKREKEWWDE